MPRACGPSGTPTSTSRRSPSTWPRTTRCRARRRCARALRRVRLRHGRLADPLHGPHPHDGRGPAVPSGRNLARRSICPSMSRSRTWSTPTSEGLEARPQGAGHLPRQLQGRPAAVGRRKVTTDTGAVIEVDHAPVRRRLPKQAVADDLVPGRDIEGYLTAGSCRTTGSGRSSSRSPSRARPCRA